MAVFSKAWRALGARSLGKTRDGDLHSIGVSYPQDRERAHYSLTFRSPSTAGPFGEEHFSVYLTRAEMDNLVQRVQEYRERYPELLPR